MIARAKFQGQCTSPGIERAGFVIPAGSYSDLFILSETHVLALVLRKNFTFRTFRLSFFSVYFQSTN